MSSGDRPSQRGFTLLEVLCALAILAVMGAMIARMCHSAFEKGSRALDLRELREAADTVFRRLCYEDGRHTDGLRASLEDFYAGWAELPSLERERWRPYHMEFRRRPRTAAGEPGTTGAESLTGDSSGTGTGTGSGTGTGTGSGSGSEGDEEDEQSVELMQLTLTIWHEEAPDEELIVLQTLLPPQGDPTKPAGGSTGGSR